MTEKTTAEAGMTTLREAEKYAVSLEQCSLFVDSPPLKKAMTEAATYLRALAASPAPSAPAAVPDEADRGGFAEWSTADLAGQCRMQAREMLDPELSRFFTATADRLRALAPAPAAPPADGGTEDVLGYATRLAQSLSDKHFPNPEWRPLPDLYGVLTQIDNMSTGLSRTPAGAAGDPVGVDVGDAMEAWGSHFTAARATRPASQAPAASAGGDVDQLLDDAAKLIRKQQEWQVYGEKLERDADAAMAEEIQLQRRLVRDLRKQLTALAPTAQAQPSGREEIAAIICDLMFGNPLWHLVVRDAEAGNAIFAPIAAKCRKVADAILAAQPVVEGGAGFVSVPELPTPEMREAFDKAQAEYEEGGFWSPDHQYRAMIDARPAPATAPTPPTGLDPAARPGASAIKGGGL